MRKIKLCEKSSLLREPGSRVVVWHNGQAVTVEQLRGAAPWNKNDKEDDMLVSFAGRQKVQLRDRWIELDDGEAVVIPKGTEYRPVASGEVEILSF